MTAHKEKERVKKEGCKKNQKAFVEGETRTSRSFKVSDWDILKLPVFSSFMKFCAAQTFLVERHRDVVLEVIQVAGSKFLFYETCRYLP